jgi:hypothetical protein
MIGGDEIAADHVRSLAVSRQRSDVDLLRNLDCVIDLDAEVTNGALYAMASGP